MANGHSWNWTNIVTVLETFPQCFSYTVKVYGVPAVGGLKFSMAQKNFAKSASWGKFQLGEVLVGGQQFNPWTDDFFQF